MASVRPANKRKWHLWCALWLLLGWPGSATADAEQGLTHEVRSGETLTAIAQRYGLALAALLEQNPSLDPDRIREGQRIVIDGDKRRVRYRVSLGDTLTAIAKRFSVTRAQVARWNPGLRVDHIREGQHLVLWTERPRSASVSIGSPSRGRLENAQRLPRHPGLVIREFDRAYGTDEAVRAVLGAVSAVRKRHPRAPKLRVHDISLKKGGPMRHHRSHQSGRDVDLAYFQRQCPKGVCGFRPVGRRDLDVARTWELLHYWLERGALEAVFIDYPLQAALYRHARARGASDEQLRLWFQYPNGRGDPFGIIRHFPKHGDHMHVRFACHASDERCKSFRPLLTARAQTAAR